MYFGDALFVVYMALEARMLEFSATFWVSYQTGFA